MKHISGDFNRWITRFEDQMETCETIGVELSEEAKMFYFMNNLNDSIFGDVKSNYMDLSTRALFPDTYEEIKQRVIAEYGQITSRKPQTVLKVIRGDDAKRYGESSFKAEEEGCHICGVHGHFWKSCKHYNKKYSLEQNRNYFQKKQKRERDEDTKAPDRGASEGSEPRHRGGAQRRGNNPSSQPTPTPSDSRPEQARYSREIDDTGVEDAHLDAEELSLVCRCKGDTIDLLLDTGIVWYKTYVMRGLL